MTHSIEPSLQNLRQPSQFESRALSIGVLWIDQHRSRDRGYIVSAGVVGDSKDPDSQRCGDLRNGQACSIPSCQGLLERRSG